MKKKFDLIFSLGAACSCSTALRKSNLQIASYPLDWVFGSDLEGRINILNSHFKRFIEKRDLSYVFSERSISCDAYHNIYNDLTFNHDFSMGKPLEKTYSNVLEKYNRRIIRLLDNIHQSKKILAVYIEIPSSSSAIFKDEYMVKLWRKVQTTFENENFDLLYISQDNNLPHGQLDVKQITEHITWIRSNYKSLKKNDKDYSPDFKILLGILKEYKLNLPYLFLIKRKIFKLIVNLIPYTPLRKKLRRKYHVQ